MIASLIETCKLNGIEPFGYLANILVASVRATNKAGLTSCCPEITPKSCDRRTAYVEKAKDIKRSTFTASVVTMMLTAGAARADPEQFGYGGHMTGGFGHGLLGGAMMVVFWVGAIVITVLAIRWLSQNGGKGKGSPALGILQGRLALGGIDADEYQTRQKALEE